MELTVCRIHRSSGNHPIEIPLPSYADTRLDALPPSYDYVTGLEGNSIHKSDLSEDSMSSQPPGTTNTVFVIGLPDLEVMDTTRPASTQSKSTAEHNRCTCIFLTSAGAVTGLFLALILSTKVF